MKVNSSEKKEKKEKVKKLHSNLNSILEQKELNDLTPHEIDSLTVYELDILKEKYQSKHPKPTIIGRKPYRSFLEGITGDTWMSVGDKLKED